MEIFCRETVKVWIPFRHFDCSRASFSLSSLDGCSVIVTGTGCRRAEDRTRICEMIFEVFGASALLINAPGMYHLCLKIFPHNLFQRCSLYIRTATILALSWIAAPRRRSSPQYMRVTHCLSLLAFPLLAITSLPGLRLRCRSRVIPRRSHSLQLRRSSKRNTRA